jgi:hypothetical protein
MAGALRRFLSWADRALLVLVVAGGAAFGYQHLRAGDDGADRPQQVEAGRDDAAVEGSPILRALDRLPVKGRAPRTGYDRALFGVGSVDLDRNGCDVRNDTLRRDLLDVEVKPGTNGCKVLRGRLLDPYTGKDLNFDADGGATRAIEVDHVVALSDAWQKGAQQLSPDERVHFGNDPRNLLAVSATANRRKGDSDAATWLPRRSFRCEYVTRQIVLKSAYGLWVTAAERDAMRRVLTTDCSPP